MTHYRLLVAALVAAFALTACGEKAATTTTETKVETTAPATTPEQAAPAAQAAPTTPEQAAPAQK